MKNISFLLFSYREKKNGKKERVNMDSHKSLYSLLSGEKVQIYRRQFYSF